MDQKTHNVDFKAEKKEEPVQKRQKTLLSLIDPGQSEDFGYVIFTNEDRSKEKIFDARILNNFSHLKLSYENNKNSKIMISNEYFAILPFINMIFKEKNFNTSISKVINDGNFDIKVHYGMTEVIDIINFINTFTNGSIIENCATKFPWLLNLLTDLLNSNKIPDDYAHKMLFYIYTIDKTNDKLLFNLFDNTYKIICDNFINKDVKLSIIKFGSQRRATIDINKTVILRRLPDNHAKYLLNKMFPCETVVL
jgi:SAM-dependent MidA family methyltransferase